METDAKIYLAGHTGLLGQALLAKLRTSGFTRIVTQSRSDLDLTSQRDVRSFFENERPKYVVLAAAKVGGIKANISQSAQFIYENLAIQTNVIHSCYEYGIERLLFFGSSCVYPRDCPQPMKEEYLLSGYLEPTNEPYAVAKIAGIKMCEAYNKQYGTNFVCTVATTIYGPNDNFDLNDSHVIPALIRKFHEAHTKGKPAVEIWGTGNPVREFIYVDDVAAASMFLLESLERPELLNVGVGQGISVKDLAYLVKDVVGYGGNVVFDTSKPDGMPKKVMEVSRINRRGWHAEVPLEKGIIKTYDWYRQNLSKANRK